jgi:hypothetical protein
MTIKNSNGRDFVKDVPRIFPIEERLQFQKIREVAIVRLPTNFAKSLSRLQRLIVYLILGYTSSGKPTAKTS